MGFSWGFAAKMAKFSCNYGCNVFQHCLTDALSASGYEQFCRYDDVQTAYVNDAKNIVVLLDYDYFGELKCVFVGRGHSAKSCRETFHRPFRIDGEAKLRDI